MNQKIFISELGLNDGSVFENLTFKGSGEDLSDVFECGDNVVFKIEEENKILFVPDAYNIAYLIFGEKNFENLNKPDLKFSEELLKADKEKKSDEVISNEEINNLLNISENTKELFEEIFGGSKNEKTKQKADEKTTDSKISAEERKYILELLDNLLELKKFLG